MIAASGADRCPVDDYRCGGCPGARCRVPAAASGADQPTLRDQLAEVLAAEFDGPLDWGRQVADVLLPVIEADRERAKAEGGVDRLTDDELADEVVRRRLTLGAIDRAAIRAVDRAAALRAET